MPHARSRFGARGEEVAAAYLTERGYRVIDRNARTLFGELDLVCEAPRHSNPCTPLGALVKWGRKREVVFVEVKTRSSDRYGAPEEAITRTKQRHLVRAARAYMTSHAALRHRQFRIDVVAITKRAGCEPEIVHIISAVGDI